MNKRKVNLVRLTAEEEAAIAAHLAGDPDTYESCITKHRPAGASCARGAFCEETLIPRRQPPKNSPTERGQAQNDGPPIMSKVRERYPPRDD